MVFPVFVVLGVGSPRPLGEGFAQPTTGLNRAPLTVPLLCSLSGRCFQPKGANQVYGCCAQVEAVQRRPQVDHVALLATPRVEAGEHVVLEVDAEGATATITAVNRAGTAALRTAAAQSLRQPQVRQQTLHRQLCLDVGEVDGRPLADRPRLCYLVGTGRADHFFRRHTARLVARGLLLALL